MSSPARCPECASENVMFSRKRHLHVCEDCGREFTTEKPFIPHRVFLSYGHDEHVSLALRLRDDLKARGHDVWFDEQRLQPGHDWEASIDEGIEHVAAAKPQAAVVLLLTPHAVRRPDGYCLNEVARALARGLRVIPLMVVTSEPPLSICRIQWLDMRECIPINEKAAMYHPRFERLVAALEEGRLDFEGAQQRLLKALQPLEFEADVLHHLPRFIGREWVFAEIQRWLDDPVASRVFWITGGPGVGKTALSAWISSRYPHLKALHLCKFGHAQKSDPRAVVTSLVYQLSTQLPDYEAALARLDVERFAADDARTVFDNLLVQPLSRLRAPDRTVVMLIDALDEATRRGRNELASFIAGEFEKTPKWLRLLITSRPEQAVTLPLQRLNPFVLDTEIEANRADLRLYLSRELDSFLQQRSDGALLVETILKRSEGVFLYVERVCDDVRRGHLSLDQPNDFPEGLGGVFWQFFERQFPSLDHFQEKVRPALRAILAAREPLPVAILQALFQWRDEDLRDFTRLLGSLFPVTEEGGCEVIKPYHKSLADWLGDESKAGPYFVSAMEGHRQLASAGWKAFKKTDRNLMRYFMAHLPHHLLTCGEWLKTETLLTDIRFLEAKVCAGLSSELLRDFAESGSLLPAESPRHRILSLLEEALRRDIHFIASHAHHYPQALFQCLWNTCWWHDSKSGHVPLGDTQGVAPVVRGIDSEDMLRRLLERWLEEKKQREPGFLWLRALRQPAVALGSSQQSVFRGHSDVVYSVAYSPDGRQLASGACDNTVRLWDVESGDELRCFSGHAHWVRCVAFSPCGRRLASASQDGTIKVWDAGTGSELMSLRGHSAGVRTVAYSQDGELIASGSDDCTARIWDAGRGCQLECLTHPQKVSRVVFLPNSHELITGSDDAIVRLWTGWRNQRPTVRHFEGHQHWVAGVAASPDGSRIASAGDRTIRVWDVQSGSELHCFSGHTDWVLSVAFSSDGGRLVSGGYDRTVRLWDLRRPGSSVIIGQHGDRIRSVAFAPRDQHVASGSSDCSVRIWNVSKPPRENLSNDSSAAISALAYSPDGAWIAAGLEDATLQVWSARTGLLNSLLSGLEHHVSQVCFSHKSDRIFAMDVHGHACLWNWPSGDPVRTVRIPSPIRSANFTSDDQAVAIVNLDERKLILDLSSGQSGMPVREEERGGGWWQSSDEVNGWTRALPQVSETVVEDTRDAQPIAWYPSPFRPLVTSPKGASWAGAEASHLQVITLEGECPQKTCGLDESFETRNTEGMAFLQRRLEGVDGAVLLTDLHGAILHAKAAVSHQSRGNGLKTELIDAASVFDGVTTILTTTLPKTIQVRVRIDGDVPQARCESANIQQSLLNLSSNARDAMPDGGVLTLSASGCRIDQMDARLPEGLEGGSYLVLSVSDTGCGIPPEIIGNIFEPFFTTKDQGRGTGLGLAVVKGLAQQHRGFIEVTTALGQGSEFRVFLPAADPGEQEAPSEASFQEQTLLEDLRAFAGQLPASETMRAVCLRRHCSGSGGGELRGHAIRLPASHSLEGRILAVLYPVVTAEDICATLDTIQGDGPESRVGAVIHLIHQIASLASNAALVWCLEVGGAKAEDLRDAIHKAAGRAVSLKAEMEAFLKPQAISRQQLEFDSGRMARQLGTMLAGFAHDCNNAVVAIGGWAELLAMNIAIEDPSRALVDALRSGVLEFGRQYTQILQSMREARVDEKES